MKRKIIGAAITGAFLFLSGKTHSKMKLKPSIEKPHTADEEAAAAPLVTPVAAAKKGIDVDALHKATGLENTLDRALLEKALIGYNKLDPSKQVLTIIDFTKHSSKKRLYVIDVANQKLLFHTHVAHGQGSGEAVAKKFSNTNMSKQSSLGFYKTGQVITSPKHGMALLVHGQEKGINDNARRREIIVHGADYVSEGYVKKHGRLGRSWGCPAVSRELNKPIINAIKDGSVIFIAGADANYDLNSALLN